MNKVLSVLAVAAILGVSFYAGHKSFGSSLEYEHADVIDLFANKCAKGQFIGGCTGCGGCADPVTKNPTKYKAGGCSYFKNTFCTLCNSIRHCDQANTWCTTKDNHYCDKCQPGFFGPQCQPCKECSDTEYVLKACVTQHGKDGPDADTVCKACDQCHNAPVYTQPVLFTKGKKKGKVKVPGFFTKAKQGTRSYLTKTCIVGGNGVTTVPGQGAKLKNSICSPCRVCLEGFEYTQRTCESPQKLGYYPDPTNKKKLPDKMKQRKILADQVASLQQFVDPETKARHMPMDTQCEPCTGCMAEEGVKSKGHPDLAATKKKNEGEKALWATQVCANVKDPKSNLYLAPKGAAKCATCKQCPAGSYIEKPCDPGHPHKEWRCKTYRIDEKNNNKVLVSGQTEQCKVTYDKTTKQPKVANNEEFVNAVEAKVGSDTVCKACSRRPKNHWTVFPCNSKHTSDAVHQKCSVCQPGEYQFSACGKFQDTICPSCPNAREKLYKNSKEFKSGLMNCKLDAQTGLPKTQCSSVLCVDKVTGRPCAEREAPVVGRDVLKPKSTRCGHWIGEADQKPFRWTHDDKVGHQLPQDPDRCLPWTRGGKFARCGEWKSECKDDFYGPSCCYHKHAYGCGVLTTRERSAKRMKYPTKDSRMDRTNQYKNNPANGFPKEGYFAQFCMSLCSEFPDCLAVEIEDGGDYSNPAGTPNEKNEFKKCFFKSAFTQDQRYKWKGAFEEDVKGADGKLRSVKREGDPNLDCYSNTCRQNIYTLTPSGKPLRIINYRVPKKSKTIAENNLKIANDKCTNQCTPEQVAKLNCKSPCPKDDKSTKPDCVTKCVKNTLKRLGKTTMTKARMQAVKNTVERKETIA